MKKRFKSFAALILSLAMVVTMGLPAFAASTATGTQAAVTSGSKATVDVATGNIGDTLDAFKVVDVTYSDTANTVDYAFSNLFQTYLTANNNALTLAQYEAMANDPAELKTLLDGFTKYVRTTEGLTATATATTDNNGAASFTLPLGQYIIVGMGNTTGALVYQSVTAEVVPTIVNGAYVISSSYSVAMKTTKPSGVKTLDSGTVTDEAISVANTKDKETASVGKPIGYTLSGTVPTYPSNATNTTYYMQDTLSAGLTLISTADNIVVKGYSSSTDTVGKVLTKGTDYTIQISGQELYIDYVYANIKAYTKVTASYTAELNKNAVIASTGNPNTYDLVWSNSPYNGGTYKPGDTPNYPKGNGYGQDENKKVVYTYALVINKFEEKNADEKLAGATFDLYDSSNTKIATLITDANGAATYVGLAKGNYYLKETKAPTGYRLDTNSINFSLTYTTVPYSATTVTEVTKYTYTSNASEALTGYESQATLNGDLVWINSLGNTMTGAAGADGYTAAYVKTAKKTTENVVSISKGSTTDGVVTGGYYKADVSNAQGTNILPTTGGMGTTLFTIIGIALMVGAAVVIISKKRLNGFAE